MTQMTQMHRLKIQTMTNELQILIHNNCDKTSNKRFIILYAKLLSVRANFAPVIWSKLYSFWALFVLYEVQLDNKQG